LSLIIFFTVEVYDTILIQKKKRKYQLEFFLFLFPDYQLNTSEKILHTRIKKTFNTENVQKNNYIFLSKKLRIHDEKNKNNISKILKNKKLNSIFFIFGTPLQNILPHTCINNLFKEN